MRCHTNSWTNDGCFPMKPAERYNWIHCNHNIISSEGDQDTAACKLSGHSFYEFSRQCPKNPIWPVSLFKITPKWKNQQTMTIIYSVLKVARIHLCAKVQAIPSMRSPGNARKPVSPSQNSGKIKEINRPWPLTYQFWRWAGYISMQNFRPFPWCVLREMPGTPNLTRFTKSKWHQKEENQQTMTII